jgi:hypothetical protein
MNAARGSSYSGMCSMGFNQTPGQLSYKMEHDLEANESTGTDTDVSAGSQEVSQK